MAQLVPLVRSRQSNAQDLGSELIFVEYCLLIMELTLHGQRVSWNFLFEGSVDGIVEK